MLWHNVSHDRQIYIGAPAGGEIGRNDGKQIFNKGNPTSLKKFYTFMHEKILIDKEDLIDLKQTINENMPEWLATLRRYDDPSFEDVW